MDCALILLMSISKEKSYDDNILLSLLRLGHAPEPLGQILCQTPAALELREEPFDLGVAVPRRGHPRRQSLVVGRPGPPPPYCLAQRPHDLEVTLAGRHQDGRRTVVARGKYVDIGQYDQSFVSMTTPSR